MKVIRFIGINNSIEHQKYPARYAKESVILRITLRNISQQDLSRKSTHFSLKAAAARIFKRINIVIPTF